MQQNSANKVDEFGGHQDHFLHDARIAAGIGGDGNKTMSFYLDYDKANKTSQCRLTIKVPSGTVVFMPRGVAGVTTATNKEGSEMEIYHGVNNIDRTLCLGIHYRKVEGKVGPSCVVGSNWDEKEEGISFTVCDDGVWNAIHGMAGMNVGDENNIEEGGDEVNGSNGDLNASNEGEINGTGMEDDDSSANSMDPEIIEMVKLHTHMVVKEESTEGWEELFGCLFDHNLIILDYIWNKEELTPALEKLEKEDNIFVDDHKSRKGKCAWWDTGGPAFSERTIQKLGTYKVFRDYFKYLCTIFDGGELAGAFLAYYDHDAEHDPMEMLSE